MVQEINKNYQDIQVSASFVRECNKGMYQCNTQQQTL